MLKLQLRRMLGPTHKFLSKYMARWASQHNCFWIINPEMTSKEGRKYNVLVGTSTVGGVGGCFLSKLTAAESYDQSLRSLQPMPPLLFCFVFFRFQILRKPKSIVDFLFVTKTKNKNKNKNNRKTDDQ